MMLRVDRADVGLLLAEAVHAEGDGQHERDPWWAAVVDGDDQHRHGADRYRDPLRSAQALTEHEHAEQDRQQRVDEVAQTRLDDVPGVDAVDIGAPVEGHEDGRGRQQPQLPAVAEHGADAAQA
jgi:hypothetical protein